MNYKDAYDYLIRSYTVGKKHGLISTKSVLQCLGDPQDFLQIIHVAGTNGKGSVCAMLSSVLKEAGYRVGCFTSPHLQKFNERFSINGNLISDDDFAYYIGKVKTASEKAFGNNAESLSYFEILTVLCFCYFYEKKVDCLVLETGIGGRLDATNIIENPVLSVITAIGLDHTEYLGETIEEITKEKGGIIKKNCPVVLYSQSNKVYNMIKTISQEKNAELYYSDDLYTNIICNNLHGIIFSASCAYYSYNSIKLNLIGSYQINNACTVLLAVCALNKAGLAISGEHVLNGLHNVRWPGRMEIVGRDPLFVLEGAHNFDGAQMMAESAGSYFKNKIVTMIIGILKDKEYTKMIQVMTQTADKIIFTKPAYAARTLEPSALYDSLENKNRTVLVEPNYKRAVDLAFEITPKDGIICCTGSLYLVGDVKDYLNYRKQEAHNDRL